MGVFSLSVLAALLVAGAIVWVIVDRNRASPIRRRGRLLAMGSGVAYGVLGRISFGIAYAHFDLPTWLTNSFAVMSVSFLFILPFAIGYLDQSVSHEDPPTNHPWVRAFFTPMLSVLLMLGLMALLSIEGSICIAMALPAFLLLAGVGGLVGYAVQRSVEGKARTGMLSAVLFLPYLACPAEGRLSVPDERRAVENSVTIHAPPNLVWREIASVRAIDPSELPFRFAHLIGLPRPIEATLSEQRPGGVRIATFERGLSFRETVTEWQPGRRLSFSIHAEDAPRAALDEHVAVGGPYFDVLDGTYELFPAGDGGTRLVLTSHQRLSTRFNFYARAWTDLIMSDLQSAIMTVIRARAERATSLSAPART